ncbi:hypothetical protein CHS0354_028756 [Potamilus streckersoni]|uniref:Uncharacterized protein n=1 Tax=Potamilus streckersoni TaxID=2493646 RepID=A0AAE0S8U4_9BIVA|nr:hypothetical protein CHS0354_028756 [Potamilus streckersoni]
MMGRAIRAQLRMDTSCRLRLCSTQPINGVSPRAQCSNISNRTLPLWEYDMCQGSTDVRRKAEAE